jgi:hypothetical protein
MSSKLVQSFSLLLNDQAKTSHALADITILNLANGVIAVLLDGASQPRRRSITNMRDRDRRRHVINPEKALAAQAALQPAPAASA